MMTFAIMAGGDIVMKSNSSPRTPIPSLSMRNMGKDTSGCDTSKPSLDDKMELYSNVGIVVEISAPVVVVPTEPEPTTNMEEFPDNNDDSVDFPTPRAPTTDTFEKYTFFYFFATIFNQITMLR